MGESYIIREARLVRGIISDSENTPASMTLVLEIKNLLLDSWRVSSDRVQRRVLVYDACPRTLQLNFYCHKQEGG